MMGQTQGGGGQCDTPTPHLDLSPPWAAAADTYTMSQNNTAAHNMTCNWKTRVWAKIREMKPAALEMQL